METAASWSLAFAYIISVAYYLNLLGAFGVRLTSVNDPLHAKLLTTAMFCIITVVGWTYGFKMLEQKEYISVTTKLAIIAGLLLGLLVYFCRKAGSSQLEFNAPSLTGLSALTLGFGLIVTVQGFETSRYLGATYDSHTRIKSQRWAQWISSAIYMIYIVLLAYVFPRGELKLTETAIIDMMEIVAPILPALLVAAALAAQFSAAVADTSGAGGMAAELTNNRIEPRIGYAAVTGVGLFLTWSANIFEIISYASRAFAIYYALQAPIAAIRSWQVHDDRRLSPFYAMLAGLGGLITIFGQPVEI